MSIYIFTTLVWWRLKEKLELIIDIEKKYKNWYLGIKLVLCFNGWDILRLQLRGPHIAQIGKNLGKGTLEMGQEGWKNEHTRLDQFR